MKPVKKNQENEPLNIVSVGDISIQARKPIKNYKEIVSGLLEDTRIMQYLQIFNRRKMQAPSYID